MPSKSKNPDAIALLKADHKNVKDLFESFEEAEEPSEKANIAREAMKELRVHSVLEEEIFYPAVRQALGEDGGDIMDESEEEHRVAKTIIEELAEEEAGDEHFEAKFSVLAESIRHHIKEEESEMFKQARSADGLDLHELAEAMTARKEQLLSDESELEAAEQKSRVKPYQELAATH
jgi:hemerythrin superfamily protein